jgi:hypothetical protein
VERDKGKGKKGRERQGHFRVSGKVPNWRVLFGRKRKSKVKMS